MEKKYIVKNRMNYHELTARASTPRCCETPSLTVPNLSMTMDELLARYARNVPLPVQKTPLWEDPNLPSTGQSVRNLDLIDLSYYMKNKMERLEILRTAVDKTKAENEKKMAELKKRNEDYYAYIDKMRAKETDAPIPS